MKVTFKSRNDGKREITGEVLALIDDFVRWTINRYIPKRSSRFLKLEIVFDGKFREKNQCHAWMFSRDDRRRSNDYVIELQTLGLNLLEILHCIAHELVHVKQQKLDEWYDKQVEPNYIVSYKNKSYVFDDDDAESYWTAPWEIEAHGSSLGLLEVWIEHRGYKRESWARQPLRVGCKS